MSTDQSIVYRIDGADTIISVNAAWAELEGPHREFHESAHTIHQMIRDGRCGEARSYHMNVTKPLAYTCLDRIDKILAWHDAQVQAMHAAEDVYAQKTAPALHQTQELLHELRRSLPIDRVKDRFHPIG